MKNKICLIQPILIITFLILKCQCLRAKNLYDPPSLQHEQNTNPTAQQQKQQLDYLINLQNNYKQTIQNLNNQAQSTRSQLQKASNLDERITILESAILQERAKIAELTNSLVPNPSQAGLPCIALPQDQQLKLSQDSSQIQARINQLEQLTKIIPECDQTIAMKQQIRKMKIDLNILSNAASNPCQPNLLNTPAVYTINLYQNNNWVLGSYTKDQVVDEYYQNFLKYGNISTCPLNRPFVLSSTPASFINSCVKCPDATPFFDFSGKKCIACATGQTVDPATQNCGYPPRNSNYTYGPNFNNSNSSQPPKPQPNRTSCPPEAPFYNNVTCVACSMPYNYWQVSQNKCKQCPNGKVFNINLKQCITPVSKMLTRLNGTQWIANNPTQVYTTRQQILQINKTTGQYKLCPESNPYYDNTYCVNCNKTQQFNLDNLQCVNPPYNTIYSKNMHRYVVAQSNKQMDPNATRYIANQTVTAQPNVPFCNTSYPYYDEISCIYCSNPYNIFNYDTKQCTICHPQSEIYNDTTHKCQRKPSIYVYGSYDRLLATPTTSISMYNATLNQAIAQNPQAFPDKCPDSTTYAAINTCVKCNPNAGLYFNVQTLNCTACDGIPDPKTALCVPKKYYFVNTGAPNLIVSPNTTLQQIKANNDKIIQSNPTQYSTCPLETPYPYNNLTVCGKCPSNAPLYSIEKQSCTYCPPKQAYDSRNYQCKSVLYLTNYDKNVIIALPLTYNSLIQEEAQLNSTNLTQKCPQKEPYTPDHEICMNCFGTAPYFDVKSGLCVSCPFPTTYSLQSKACVQTIYLTNLAADRLQQIDNYTVINVKAQQDALRASGNANYVNCSLDQPYGQASGCVNCTQGTVFNLKTSTCEPCPQNSKYWPDTRKCLAVTNISNVNASTNNIVQSDSYTLNNYLAQINKQKMTGPTQLCPAEAPFVINRICTLCVAPTPFFILANQSCGSCSNYKNDTMTCPPKVARYPNLTNWFWVTNDGNPDKYINEAKNLKQQAAGSMCPAFYNPATMDCIQCPTSYYYNVDEQMCQNCPSGSVFDINTHSCARQPPAGTYFTNIDVAPNNLEIYGGLTLNEIQTTQANIKNQYPNAQYCPNNKPFFDNIQCVSCPSYKPYFNLRYGLCQVCLANQYLQGNDCIDRNGNKVWQQPNAQNVYPYLFQNFGK